MRKNILRKATAVSAGIALATLVGAGSLTAYAREVNPFELKNFMQQINPSQGENSGNMFGGSGNLQMGMGFGTAQTNQNMSGSAMQNTAGLGMPGQVMQNGMGNVTYADEPTEIVTTTVENTAAALTADYDNATTYVMSESNNDIKISSAGTYIVTGECSDGNITVKKGTTDVVLILRDLDLTSTTGATVSLNKTSEVKLIIEGTVNLTDAEDPADEDSADAEVADAFDGAAIKAKDGSNVYLTGTGTLNIDASDCKNGIKVGDADYPSFVIDGSLTINIDAANDAINAGYDLTILGGNINITAGDDALHADRIITLGTEGKTGPEINILNCTEGIEGTVVNLFGGSATINASDDGVNAANSDGTYSSEMEFAINITGGNWTVNCKGDGLDSNGNINITGGYTTINSGTSAGEAGLDYVGSCYVAEGCLDNKCGASCDGALGGIMGEFGMETPEMNSENSNVTQEVMPQTETDMNGEFGMMEGQPPMAEGNTGMMEGQPPMAEGNTGMMEGQPPMAEGNMGMMQGQPPMAEGNMGMMQGQPPMTEGNMGMMQGQPPMAEGNMGMMQGQLYQRF
ncbi:MAG: carbohydrate-binding domain-containing protein [Acetatifactor sp.]|nr:carbohydrate-binding domain-containing protein [Acetatifactor sp.]